MKYPEQNMSQPILNWPKIGLQKIDKFNTKGLASICFLEFFLGGKGYPTTTVQQRYFAQENDAKHLIKFCVYNQSHQQYVYPFDEHWNFFGWMQDMIELHRTLSWDNFAYTKTRIYNIRV